MKRTVAYALAVITGLVLMAGIGLWTYDWYRQPSVVAEILNIPSAPKSLRVVACKSPFTTDVLTTCSIEITPSEFSALLLGYKFTRSPINETSYTLAAVPKVGPEFPVTVQYRVQPVSFKYGGSVTVFANAERDRAIVDLYIE